MNKIIIGALFIVAGIIYGSMAFDQIYRKTLGWMVQNQWMKQPEIQNMAKLFAFGRRPTILMYALILILLGIYILWKL